MSTVDEVLAAALALPTAERARLIPLLRDQILPEDWPLPSQAWLAEAKRRSENIESGAMKADDWKDVRDEARRKAGLS